MTLKSVEMVSAWGLQGAGQRTPEMRLAENLSLTGLRVGCVTFDRRKPFPTLGDAPVSIEHVPYFLRRMRGTDLVFPKLTALRDTLSRLAETDPDVWHLHHPSSLSVLCSGLLAKRGGAPVVFTTHDPQVACGRRRLVRVRSLGAHAFRDRRRAVEWALRSLPYIHSDRVVALTDFERRTLVAQGLDPARVVVIPNGVDPVPKIRGLKEKLSIGDVPLVLTVARFVRQKGYPTLLRAIPSVISRMRAHFLFIGRQTRELASLRLMSSDFKDSITFLVSASESDLASAYTECDLFVLPSLYESFGMASVEAMSAGKPVVSTGVGGVPEIVLDGRNGTIVPPEDPGALADAIVNLLAHHSLRERMGYQSAEDVGRRFNWDLVTRAYRQAYSEVRSR
jgi:glycosyltransferase involved in cell wall biosynthesis